MSPPVPGILWRQQDPNDNQPLVIDGHVVPRGTLFGVSAYAIHHNKAYFPDSYSFRPERWLETSSTTPENQTARKPIYDAFTTFSHGSRSCAGKAMAYLESSTAIAKTLWHFNFESAPEELGEVGAGTTGREGPGEFQLEDIFTTRHTSPYLVFHPRSTL